MVNTFIENVNKTGPKVYSWKKKILQYQYIAFYHYYFSISNLHGNFLMVSSYNFLCMLACANDFDFTN